jgi:hypothetical protein
MRPRSFISGKICFEFLLQCMNVVISWLLAVVIAWFCTKFVLYSFLFITKPMLFKAYNNHECWITFIFYHAVQLWKKIIIWQNQCTEESQHRFLMQLLQNPTVMFWHNCTQVIRIKDSHFVVFKLHFGESTDFRHCNTVAYSNLIMYSTHGKQRINYNQIISE